MCKIILIQYTEVNKYILIHDKRAKRMPMYLTCPAPIQGRGGFWSGFYLLTPDLSSPSPHRAGLPVRGDGQEDDQGWDEHRQNELLSWNPWGQSGGIHFISRHSSIQASLEFVDFRRSSIASSLVSPQSIFFNFSMKFSPKLTLSTSQSPNRWLRVRVLFLHLPFSVSCWL